MFVRVALLLVLLAFVGSLRAPRELMHASFTPNTCAPLLNKDTYFSVEVEVGTPPQSLQLLADTGSDATVLTSCGCVKMGGCHAETCFEPSSSTTFAWSSRSITLSYGSGDITSLITGDVATLAGRTVSLSDSVLLTVQSQLDFNDALDGLLGLGNPKCGDDPTSRLFLEHSEVPSFSVCFNPAINGVPTDGVLRLGSGMGESVTALRSIGLHHWGLGLTGVTVGNEKASMCNASAMPFGQEMPCGMIPDSGTTNMLIAREHLVELATLICTKWNKCNESTTLPLDEELEKTLSPCEDLQTLPNLMFDVADLHGKTTTLELPWSAYVIEVRQEVEWSGETKRAGCYLAFDAEDYSTDKHGPVWIMGMPLFFEYVVGYDLISKGISFSQGCGSCDENEGGGRTLLSESQAIGASSVRQLSGRPRRPSRNKRLPL